MTAGAEDTGTEPEPEAGDAPAERPAPPALTMMCGGSGKPLVTVEALCTLYRIVDYLSEDADDRARARARGRALQGILDELTG